MLLALRRWRKDMTNAGKEANPLLDEDSQPAATESEVGVRETKQRPKPC